MTEPTLAGKTEMSSCFSKMPGPGAAKLVEAEVGLGLVGHTKVKHTKYLPQQTQDIN